MIYLLPPYYFRTIARQLRLEYEGALYHITSRGNAQAAIYLDVEDRTRYLGVLGREGEQLTLLCPTDLRHATVDLGGPGPQQAGLPPSQTDARWTFATVLVALGTVGLVSVLINLTLYKALPGATPQVLSGPSPEFFKG